MPACGSRPRSPRHPRARSASTASRTSPDRSHAHSTAPLPIARVRAAGRRPPARAHPPRPIDAALAEYRPEARALPRFHVWTLGCQMNRSDSEEMAGGCSPPGCAEAPASMDAPTSSSSTPARSARRPSRRSSAGRASSRGSRRANPALRVVLTGCSVREPDRAGLRRRFPAVDLFLRPDEEPELVDRLGPRLGPGAVGAVGATTTVVGRTVVGVADHLPATRARRGRRRRRPPRVGDQRLAADHLRLRQDLHLLHRAVQPRPGAEPPVRRDRRRGAGARRRRLPRGHAPRPERELVRPRPRAGGALRARRHRALGRPPARPPRPPGPRRADPRDRRAADRRRRAGDPAPALRHLAPVGPLRPADRGDGRLPVGLRAPPPAGPVGRRRGAPADGPPVHDRALPRAARPDPRGRARASRSRPTSSSGSAARPRPQFEATLRLLETVRYDQVFAAAYSRAARHARDAPRRRRAGRRQAAPPERAARAPGGDRARAQPGVARAEVEVLVDAVSPPRSHDHDEDAGATEARPRPGRLRLGPDAPATSSSTWPAARSSSGALVTVRDRPRRPVRAAGHARRGVTERAAAPRHRRRDRDRQDRARDRVAERLRAERHRRRDHLGRFAPGLPRPRHRDGQGDGRGAGAASRTTASTSSTPTSRSRVADFARHAREALAGDRRARRRRDPRRRHGPLPAGVARGLDTDAPAARTRRSAPGSRRSSRPTASEPLVERLTRPRARAAPRRRHRATRVASSARSRSPSCRGDEPPPPRAATTARSPGSACAVEPATHRDAGSRTARASPVRRRPVEEARGPARAVRPGAAGVLARSATARPGRSSTASSTRDAAIAATPGATSRSRSASGRGSARSRGSSGWMRPTGHQSSGRRRSPAG